MKAIKMRIQRNSRPLVILLATVVAIITTIVVANATQTITTPNAAFISFNLAPLADSAAITPVASKPVLVMGCNTTTGNPGIGQVSLLNLSGAISWVGLESEAMTITTGFSSTVGTHIVYIDFGHHVDIRVASAVAGARTITIHNAETVNTEAGSVTLIW